MSNKRTKIDVEGYRGWTDLHEDILLLIKEKLKIVDQLRFRAVCKNWRSVAYLKSADQLPWILVLRRTRKSDMDGFIDDIVYDPSNSRQYTLGRKSITPYPFISSRKAYYSEFGWIFLASTLLCGNCKLSLYHSFTRTTIDLPDLNSKYCGNGTFSTVPTLSDCVFCVTSKGTAWVTQQGETSISIFRTGDVAWRTFNLKTPPRLSEVEDLFYMQGNIFCVFKMGLVWAFNIVSHDWGEVPIDTSQIMNVQSWYAMNIVVSNGEVLLVYFHKNWKPWYIFKLDWSLMAWVKVATLGNRALFLANETSLSIPTSGEIKSLAGHIHFHNKFRLNHYSFKNNGRHKNSKLRALVNRYYSYFRRVDSTCDCVWVEPHC